MSKMKELLQEDQRYYALWKESNIIYEEWAKAHGISANGLLIIQSLYDGICSQKEISKKWCIPKQTINTILKDFEVKGYLKFTAMEEDKRNKQIELTKAGREFVDNIIRQIQEKELYVIRKMGLDRMRQMNDSIELFNQLFREDGSLNHE